MTANIFGNRFYGHREPAWHKLGLVTQEDMTAQEVLMAIGSYWLEKRPVYMVLNGKNEEQGDYGIVRSATPDDPMERLFGYVSKHYEILQPDKIAELFDTNVGEPVETMGMLQNGQKLFLTWELPFFTVDGEKIKVYGLINTGYDGKNGSSLYLITQKVVCQNTLNIAIQRAESEKDASKGNAKLFTGRHNSSNLERDLGLWLSHVAQNTTQKLSEVAEIFNQMAAVKISEKEDVYNLLFQIYPEPRGLPEYFPEKLRVEKQTVIDTRSEQAEKDRNLAWTLFNGAGTGIQKNVWGLLNAVTEKENWTGMIKKPVEYSVMLGNRQNVCERALDILTEYTYANK